MTPKILLKRYKTPAIAAVAIGYSEAAVKYWIKKNRIPPKAKIIIAAKITSK